MKKENPNKWGDVSAKIPYAFFFPRNGEASPRSLRKFSPGAANRSSAILGAAAPDSFSKTRVKIKEPLKQNWRLSWLFATPPVSQNARACQKYRMNDGPTRVSTGSAPPKC